MAAPTSSPGRPEYLLTTLEFDVLVGDVLGCGPSPLVLRIGSAGRTHGERRRLRVGAERALRERGLVGAAGTDPGLLRLLGLLAHPTEQLELRARGDPELRAVAAGRGRDGVLAVRRHDSILITACDSLPVALLGVLPPARSGSGRAVAVPTALLAGALAAPEPVAALIAGQVPAGDARLLRRMLSGAHRQAQVVALRARGEPRHAPGPGLGHGRGAELRRVGGVVGVLDGPRGRYLVSRRCAVDGAEWTTVAPVDPRMLRHRVAELLATGEPPHPGRPPPRPPRPPP